MGAVVGALVVDAVVDAVGALVVDVLTGVVVDALTGAVVNALTGTFVGATGAVVGDAEGYGDAVLQPLGDLDALADLAAA
mmetsp:Transcript_18101/g.36109  ORF Transcript_18101/g.36109 Transcript_18101/m.36109 type:complete len:80 (+) Transcript_18101:158-397(+)